MRPDTSHCGRVVTSAALVILLSSSCYESLPPVDEGDGECAIDNDGEHEPGYPYDLELFQTEVLPVLTATCAASGCHAAPEGTSGFTVWTAAAPGNCEYADTFESFTSFVDLASPHNSRVYGAFSGVLVSHPLTLPEGDSRRTALENFIDDASARYLADGGNGTTAPPGASPFDYRTFQDVIQPAMDRAEGKGCASVGCHADAAGGMTLTPSPAPDSPEMEANFIAITSRTSLERPSSSMVFLRATTRHGGGLSALMDEAGKDALLAWIEAAAANSGGQNVACVDPNRFDVGVFRDEILPILRGDINLNDTGSGQTSTGCTRGPCHGDANRPPGSLILLDSAAPEENLRNFACFVDALSPSSSQALLCPQNDPRCRRYPHPGDRVLDGIDDLNYQRLLSYLFGTRSDAVPLDYAFFVRRINPIFDDQNAVQGGAQGRTCAETTSCHGITVAGQAPPNGSNLGLFSNASDSGRLGANFVEAANFVNYVRPEESSLFLYPTNEIANTADHPTATGLPHPGGEDFAVDSRFARDILTWANGLRPDADGFVRSWLVAGDFRIDTITDATPIAEATANPTIFDLSGGRGLGGEWDGLFSDAAEVDIAGAMPDSGGQSRAVFAVAYLINTTDRSIRAELRVNSPNATRVYAGALVAGGDGGTVSALVDLPSYRVSHTATRVLIKLLERPGDGGLRMTARLSDEAGNPFRAEGGEIVVKLGPKGGI